MASWKEVVVLPSFSAALVTAIVAMGSSDVANRKVVRSERNASSNAWRVRPLRPSTGTRVRTVSPVSSSMSSRGRRGSTAFRTNAPAIPISSPPTMPPMMASLVFGELGLVGFVAGVAN